MNEIWLHRADLAESAINERHASSLWGLPHTNLAVVAWPPNIKEKLFYRWHYWWQAHYLDCLVDAALRRPTKARKQRIRETITGIQVRNLGKLTRNNYYDDKSWLALALDRERRMRSRGKRKNMRALEANIAAGADPVVGVLPWRVGEHFFNVPTNGPAAIMFARNGDIAKAREIIDWIFGNLIDEKGLVMDGVRMSMRGPELVKYTHPYCQGVVIGACVEVAEALRADPATYEDSITYLAHARAVIHATAKEMTTRSGVIDWVTGDGDGGLFKGILARYLADAAVRLPDDSDANRSARNIAKRLVMASAESVWNHRLEVDGLPVFATDWTDDAKLPHNFGVGGSALSDIVNVVRIDERDLSVQLSGWMLLEAAARIVESE
ncbi:glycoside hydrolase family 76 protein [Corynebacterium pseudotuberculosis]|uniref:glycoside hydrolase family 76 protein n=1 Tax=Corynebacterium pseudotuberculosis TaxID=1719 RepID=UPI0001E5F25D|nr:glycoside hydrolase family 76 protein [Corynebacterium pseudotuberculosis]ADO27118.1 glycoside hydrolase family 76 [Corynebacterium pseudotuberculosis I19]AFF23010.1 Glycoside hydrolase family 76 protein [Corynebacterium pseudotuberculosis P54B96]AFH52813.1 Glycoside hydrolase family 76 protein [Corynebacterium pseudotuberculosis 267]AKI59153.1 glycoside hydrolase family 76 [Corynebacterium pseudotuberculosis]ALU18533.1 glycoside hydrolase family 76 [Corynebacterium pseudotuberculosis]